MVERAHGVGCCFERKDAVDRWSKPSRRDEFDELIEVGAVEGSGDEGPELLRDHRSPQERAKPAAETTREAAAMVGADDDHGVHAVIVGRRLEPRRIKAWRVEARCVEARCVEARCIQARCVEARRIQARRIEARRRLGDVARGPAG